jgi:hypothetical protein
MTDKILRILLGVVITWITILMVALVITLEEAIR